MQVSVEKISNIERKLIISVPAEEVELAYTKKINEFAKKANIKGFRPGKAPLSYITQRFGDDARKEVLSEVMQNAIYEAVSKHQLNPVSTPRVTPKEMSPGKSLEFEVTLEVLPDIEKVEFSMDNLEKLKVDVTDADIDYVIRQLSKQYTKWHPVERPLKTGDRAIIDYYVNFDGKEDPASKTENFPFEIGSKAMLPGFDEALMNSKAGDEKTFTLNLPNEYPDKEKAGKPVEFVVTVKQVVEAKSPEINEQFVKQLGVQSGKLDDLKQQIKQSLEQERDRIVQDKIKDQVFKQLLEQNPIEVPESLIEREAKRIHDELYPNHKSKTEKEHQHSQEELTTFKDIAKKRVSVGILIAEYAKIHKVKAEKERVQKRILEIASVYENPKEVATWLASEDRLANIESQVLEDQILDKLITGINTIEKPMSYAELKGFKNIEEKE